MARIFAVNENNDLYLTNGRITVVTDLQATIQACKHAVQTILGEMILNTDQGLPNFQTIWNDAGAVAQFEAALKSTLLNIDNVIGIQSLEITITNNTLFYTARINTVFGTGIVNGSGL